jgi:hypothetical protein
LRPGNTAFKGQLKLVNGFEKDTWIHAIHALKKPKNGFHKKVWDVQGVQKQILIIQLTLL